MHEVHEGDAAASAKRRHSRRFGSVESKSAEGKIRGLRVINGLIKGFKRCKISQLTPEEHLVTAL